MNPSITEEDLRSWRLDGRSLMAGDLVICEFRLTPNYDRIRPLIKLILATPGLYAACEEALHELRIRCGYKPGDHAYDSLSRALKLVDGPA